MLPMEVKKVIANEKVKDDIGKDSAAAGPIDVLRGMGR